MIAILTPTYNRAYTLKKVYDSLVRQTNKNFVWVIVDDGSLDDTKSLVDKFILDKKIKINYYYKDNGGKHTAINFGMKKINTKYVLILDSDDTLCEDCVEIVFNKWKEYESNKKIGCLSFLKVFDNGKVIGKKYNEEEVVSNHIDFRYNRNLLGDMCEVFRCDVLKKYPFPVIKNERFLSEAIVWNRIAYDYDTVYINYPIYVAEYLSDGLTTNSLKLRYNNPNGAVVNANMFLNKRFKSSIRLKNAILYDGFSLIAKKSVKSIVRTSNDRKLSILFMPFGYLFYVLLSLKFKRRKK